MPPEAIPSVKCSSCGLPVALALLGDHVCPPNHPSLQKHRMSPKPASSLLPQRLQSLVARSATPPHKQPDEKRSNHPDVERVLSPSRDPFQRLPPDNSSMPTQKTASAIPLTLTPPPPDRVSTLVRDHIPPALQPVRVPSNASRAAPPSSARAPFPPPGESSTHPVPRRPSPLSSARRDNPPTQQSMPPPRSPFTDRPPPNVMPSSPVHPRPSFERAHTPSIPPTSRPSLDKPLSLDKPRPSLDARRPSLDSRNPSKEQNLLTPLRAAVPAPAPGNVPFPSSSPALPPPVSARQPPPPPLSLVYSRSHVAGREVDTKTGGEAGMAGVGRRGFQAVARAAIYGASRPPHQASDGHRANLPYLDINDTMSQVMQAAMTPPPLSPNSVRTASPASPFPSPVSLGNNAHINGRYSNLPNPGDAIRQQSLVLSSNDKSLPLPFPPSDVRIASPSRSPSPIPNPFERRISGETITQSPLPDANIPLPLFDILKPDLGNESDDESVYTTHSDQKRDENEPSSPSADSDVGLAYEQESDDETPVVMPLDIRKSSLKGRVNKVKFPTSVSSNGRHPSRQASAASTRSALSSRSAGTHFAGSRTRSASAATQGTVRSGGALERAMETLLEEGASISVLASGSVLASIGGSASGKGHGKPSRSNTVTGPVPPEQKPPKLPTRSHTNPSHPHIHAERVGLIAEVARVRNGSSVKRKSRTCAKCNSKIEDGRWIQMDGGNVLCERCWKNMYLPKCRRCNLPIEKQAVSSRDGQLKGKYHKECFNCHTCQKPFPDKEFYVFDGKPFCAYHYHEANDSLCGETSCGQPIEGPCAVTHSGKRYHPEHLLCEFEGGCKERLEEYWEVDGQMLCERHAAIISGHDGGWTRDSDPVDTQTKNVPGTDEGRMMKRMTRFIDLGAGGEDGLDIR